MSSFFSIQDMSWLRNRHIWSAVALLGTLTFLYTCPGVTLAHGEYVSSDPAANAMLTKAPTLITARFAESLVPLDSNMLVYDMNGKRVSIGSAQTELADPQTMKVAIQPDKSQIYVVYWYNVSAMEDHHDSGSFRFFVNPDPMLKGMLTNSSMQNSMYHTQQHTRHQGIANTNIPMWMAGLLGVVGLLLGACVMYLFVHQPVQETVPPIPESHSEIPL
jgi:methionine-rich copper-binding protein CopC